MQKNIIKVMQGTNNPMLWGGGGQQYAKGPKVKKKKW